MKKALNFIAGVLLLLAPVYFGASLPIPGADDFFSLAGLAYLIFFLAPMFVAVFLTPKLSKIYLILISAVFAFWQFGSFDWVPITFSCATLLPLAFIDIRLFRRCLLIPAVSFSAISIDAFAFHHRYAVLSYSTVHQFFDMDPNPKVITSPSGKTTIYLMSGGFQDTFYSVCISSKRLMPLSRPIQPSSSEGPTATDIIARWDGPVFLAGDKLVSLAYDERTGELIDKQSYPRGGMPVADEKLMSHTKTPEAFAEYLLSLPPKN